MRKIAIRNSPDATTTRRSAAEYNRLSRSSTKIVYFAAWDEMPMNLLLIAHSSRSSRWPTGPR